MYKDIFLNRKAVCFDLDGTIVDSHPIWLRAHRLVLENLKMNTYVEPTDYCEVGVSLTKTWENFLNKYDVDKDLTAEGLAEATNRSFVNILQTIELEPREGFWSLAAKLKEDMKLKLGLVTNTPRYVAEQVLNKIGFVSSLDAKMFGDDVQHKKPNPEMYIKVAKDLGAIKPKEIVVFEDSVVGVTAAAEAKMDIVLIKDSNRSLKDYPGNIVFAAPDFSSLADELDTTYKEAWDAALENIGEKINKKD
ncbi:HAD family phosphatase [Patescibacteria group bacterium]|nr:HAD family phosphatase [Patescibacteria group bacterium]